MIKTKENGKNLTLGMIQTYWAKIRAFTFLKKNIWICQSLDMVSYHHVKYQKKLKIQSQENFVMEKEMDGRTEKQKDESDFIGHCPTDFEHPSD